MKLAEVIELLQKFGFVEEHIRQGLVRGDSFFNAWEAMKNALKIRWDGMNQMESADKLAELRPHYDRLMRLEFKEGTAVTAKGEREKVKKKNRGFVDRMFSDQQEHRKQNVEAVLDKTAEILQRRKDREGR
jgi:hypothetical protein